MEKQVKLRYKLNKVSPGNGVIYTEDVMQKALDERILQNKLMVTTQTMDLNVVKLMNVVGICNYYKIHNNDVWFGITLFSPHDKIYGGLDIESTVRGMGVIDNNNMVVHDYNIIALDIVNAKDFLSVEDFKI